jgi:hypothetical protein
MSSIGQLKKAIGIRDELAQVSRQPDAVIAALDNQSRLLNEKLEALIQGLDNQSELLEPKARSLAPGQCDGRGIAKSAFGHAAGTTGRAGRGERCARDAGAGPAQRSADAIRRNGLAT